jgi:3-deoxy-manno-octulosonate cytidylyltransferase (CMP-KDO synthetase)
MSKVLGIIPARMGSTRFPGKPLINIHGKPMIQWVWERCQQSKKVHYWIIATDHIDIYNMVQSFGGNAMMTSEMHKSGTDRCIEVLDHQIDNFTHVINVQGDEPLISPEQIDSLTDTLLKSQAPIATLIKKNHHFQDFQNPNRVKVVINNMGEALYFSRSSIPYHSDENAFQFFWKHIGMYAFTKHALLIIKTLSPSSLEISESLEQLRWLEQGLKIQTIETQLETPSIDTPQDLDYILEKFTTEF